VSWFRAMAAILMLCSGLAGIGLAQTSPAPPQPLPQEQFDALVEAVKKAVADELKAQGAPPKAAPAKPASASPPDDDQPNLLGALGQQLSKVFAGMPLLVNSLAELPRVLDESPTGGSSTGRFFSILLVTLITALAVEATLRAVLTRLKVRLAANAAPEKGVRSLIYLACTQRPDGGFYQNFWINGRPYWHGIQLDEVSFPIMLAWRLDAQKALGNFDPYDMVLGAARYLINQGPYTPQERWEENSGYSPSTLASNIAGLVCAAEFARARGDLQTAEFILEYADFLESHVDVWTVTTQGELLPGVPAAGIEVRDGWTRPWRYRPEDLPQRPVAVEELAGSDAAGNAAMLERLLEGEEGPRREAVLLNVAVALTVEGSALSLSDAYERARTAVDSGKGRKMLETLKARSRGAAGPGRGTA